MQPLAKIRVKIRKIQWIAAAFIFATLLPAQTPPTPQPASTSQPVRQPAQVTYTNGKLLVSASNSSLNQILRDISHETGMKITGGVTDERVFGQYGPDAPAKILGQLLDGTGSNMLLLQATAATPAELILTPRHGGPSPPNPNAYHEEPAPVRPQYPLPEQPEGSAPRPRPSSDPAHAPNDIKTPQQIYEQLQRMRQQQQQPPSNPQ
jgi:hypothetical protein